MRNTAFANTANAITADVTANVIDKVTEELTAEREKVFSRISESENSILNAITTVKDSEPTDDTTSVSSLSEKMNSTVSDAVQLEILKILKEIKGDMLKCKAIEQDAEDNRLNKRPRFRRDTRFYCWTHGAGNHKGVDCRNKKEGHKDAATFKNKMGGSTNFCRKRG